MKVVVPTAFSQKQTRSRSIRRAQRGAGAATAITRTDGGAARDSLTGIRAGYHRRLQRLPLLGDGHNARVRPDGITPQHGPTAGLPPHAPLRDYYDSEDEHERFVRRMFDATAADYERVERMLA